MSRVCNLCAFGLGALSLSGVALAWPLQGPEGPLQGQDVDAASVFVESTAWPKGRVSTDPAALAAEAAAVLAYLEGEGAEDPRAAHAGLLGERGVDELRRTLRWIVEIEAEDRGRARQRLTDPSFLAASLRWFSWDPPGAPRDLRLTKYGVWGVEGRARPEPPFDRALYAVPDDEAGLDEAAAAALGPALTRYRYTRQDLISGVFEAGGAAVGQARPLVYLREADVHEANLQGTLSVTVPGEPPRLYNVARPNPWPYVRGRAPAAQERCWYFRPVEAVFGWGHRPEVRIPLTGGVAVAGDVYNLGVGRLIGLRWVGPAGPELRLVLLADTGGAFQPNLGQLDWYAGVFSSRDALFRETKALPERAAAGLLVLR
jgi:hypothetical protein